MRLFGGKGKQVHAASDVTPKGSTGRGLWFYNLPVLLVALVMLLVLGMVTLQLVQQTRDQANKQGAKVAMQALASGLAGELRVRQDQLLLVSNLPQLQQALLAGVPSSLQQAEVLAASLLPGVLQVRLYFDAEVQTDPGGAAPIGYAGVDMIKRAFSGTTPEAEVHQISAGAPYIAMAIPVQRSGTVIGVMFSGWPVNTVTRTVAQAPGFSGRFQLVQGDGGGYVIAGNGDKEPLPHVGELIEVRGSIWRLNFLVDDGGSGADAMMVFSLAGAGLLALLLAVLLQGRLLGRDIREDMATLVNLGEAISNRSTAGSVKLARVEVARNAILLLSDMARRVEKRSTSGIAKPEAVDLPSAGIVVDEMAAGKGRHQDGPIDVPEVIFRAYDVRGIVDTDLSTTIALRLGQAFAELALSQGVSRVCLAHDARMSSPELYRAFSEGVYGQGMQVVELGMGPVALPYFCMYSNPGSAAVVVTGSHNPPEYNGFKLFIDARPVAGEPLAGLRKRMAEGGFSASQGTREQVDLGETYLEAVSHELQLMRPLKVVVDGGNGAAGELACELLQHLGCEVVPLFCEPDGNFPNHHPDPGNPDNLASLQLEVEAQQADLGLAFDGDGDRIGVIDNQGAYVMPEHLLMLLSADVLQRHPGSDVIYDVKSSRNLASFILANGGRPIMWQSGHARMKEKIDQSGALLGGEFSGHFFIKERWYGSDDALYVAARLLEIFAADARPLDQIIAELPQSVSTPELQLMLEEGEPAVLMRQIEKQASFSDARIVNLDGLRVEFTEGWGLVRASNTTPSLTFRFEAESEVALNEVQQQFRDLLNKATPGVALPF